MLACRGSDQAIADAERDHQKSTFNIVSDFTAAEIHLSIVWQWSCICVLAFTLAELLDLDVGFVWGWQEARGEPRVDVLSWKQWTNFAAALMKPEPLYRVGSLLI